MGSLVVTTAVQMRFSDIDSYGHVNNLALQAYFDLGKVDLFEQLWAKVGESSVSVMVVSVHTDFLSQVRFGEQISVVTEVERVGCKSITLLQRIMRQGEECARCRAVMVAYDKQQDRSVEVPEAWRIAMG